MSILLKDLSLIIRTWVRSPVVATVCILTFSLGLGLSAATFSIVNGMLRDLPFEDPEKLVSLSSNNLSRGVRSSKVRIHDVSDWLARQSFMEGIAAYDRQTVSMHGDGGRPERYNGVFINANIFSLLRVSPVRGRLFEEKDDLPTSPPVAVIGYGTWQNRFGGSDEVVGKRVQINGELTTIIGVLPKGFEFPYNQQVWLPLRMDSRTIPRGEGTKLRVVGRVKEGVSMETVRSGFAAMSEHLSKEFPDTNDGVGVTIRPYTREYIGEELPKLLKTMLGAVICVLLIVCVNVANLLVVRTVVRSKEVAIRSVLGSSRPLIIGRSLAEIFVVSIPGGLLGIAVAYAAVNVFNKIAASQSTAFWMDVRLDFQVVLFVLGMFAVASLFTSIIPAMQASKIDMNDALKDENRGASGFRFGKFSYTLVIVEVALSCGLMIAAGLAVKSVTKLRTVDYGFSVEDMFVARVDLRGKEYQEELDRMRFVQELESGIVSLPDVEQVTFTSSLPADDPGRISVEIEGDLVDRSSMRPKARRVVITSEFFDTLGVELLQGRKFERSDDLDSVPVVLINESLAEKYFEGKSPIGERIRTGRRSKSPWMTIVGVVPDLYAGGLDSGQVSGLYVPFSQSPTKRLTMLVRVKGGDPMSITATVRDEVEAIDPSLPIFRASSLVDFLNSRTWYYRVFGNLFVVFGLAALFLATVGLYGVLAFSVRQRRREIGIRIALGARAGAVIREVLGKSFIQLGAGIALGLIMAVWISGRLRLILFEVDALDPGVFSLVTLVIAFTGLSSFIIPVMEVVKASPSETLRYD